MRKDIAELWNLTESCVKDAGFELVELQFGREIDGYVLRVFIDYPASPPGPVLPAGSSAAGQDLQSLGMMDRRVIGLPECERVSHDLSAALDVADVIRHQYKLEVSSPGLERPLRREQDFRRFEGRQVKIRAAEAVDGRRNFTGILRGAQDGVVQVDCEGRSYQVKLAAITRANLIPDWTAEFRRSQGEAADGAAGGTNGRNAS